MGKKLLIVQIGGVHTLISQARTSRDLWAGSFLIAYQITKLVQVLKKDHKASFTFPTNPDTHLPLLDWLESSPAERQQKSLEDTQQALIPLVTNRVVALVEATEEDINRSLKSVFKTNWNQITTSCLNWLEGFTNEAGLVVPLKDLSLIHI